MNTPKHTPGPWINLNGNISAKWDTGEDVGVAIVGTTTFCGDECGGPRDKRMTAENSANAKLIAAAPDLLHCCRSFVAWADSVQGFKDFQAHVENMRAAIIKATQ